MYRDPSQFIHRNLNNPKLLKGGKEKEALANPYPEVVLHTKEEAATDVLHLNHCI